MFDVSNNAIKRIEEIAIKQGHKYFRISVDGGGCQGFSYKFDFDQNLKKNDKVFKLSNYRLYLSWFLKRVTT